MRTIKGMDQPGRPDPAHPIVAAALATAGVTPDKVSQGVSWKAGTAERYGRSAEGAPRISCARDNITVHMAGPEDDIVFYVYEDMAEPREAFWLHHLEFRNWMPPDALVPAMIGCTLEQVVDIPGGAGLVIVDAAEMAKGLVLTLAPPGMTARSIAATRRPKAA